MSAQRRRSCVKKAANWRLFFLPAIEFAMPASAPLSRQTLPAQQHIGLLTIAALLAATSLPVMAEPETGIPLRMTTALAAADPQAPRTLRDPSTGVVTLTQIGEMALAAQPALIAADARARADGQRLEQALGGLRPSVGGVLGYRREFADSGSTLPFTSLSGGLNLSIPLYRPQADAGIDQARFQQSSSREAQAEAKQDILLRAIEAFLGSAQADEEADLLNQERSVLLTQRTLNQRRMEGGVGTVVEVMETSSRSESLLSQIEGAQALHRTQLAELGRLAWSSIGRVTRVRNELPPLVIPRDVVNAVTLAYEKNPTLARLTATLGASKAGISVQRAALSPTVDLVSNLDRTRLSGGLSGTVPSTGIGVQLAIPLSTGGISEARVREASALSDAAQAQLDDASRVLETELRKAYLDLQRSVEQWRIQSGVLATANATLAATRKAFDAGVRTNIDLLNSQQLSFSTQRELLRARIGVLAAQSRIAALIGDLTPAFLARIEPAFESAAAMAAAPQARPQSPPSTPMQRSTP